MQRSNRVRMLVVAAVTGAALVGGAVTATAEPAAQVVTVQQEVVPTQVATTSTIMPEVVGEDVRVTGLPAGLGSRVVTAWSSLYGAIGFEVFGQTRNVVADHERHFDATAHRLATLVGLP